MGDDDAKKNCDSGDEVLVGPDIEGFRPFVRHTADHQIQCGIAKTAEPGEPMTETGMHLRHRYANHYDVVSEGSQKGPAQVATKAYRAGWDNIFGNKTPIGQA